MEVAKEERRTCVPRTVKALRGHAASTHAQRASRAQHPQHWRGRGVASAGASARQSWALRRHDGRRPALDPARIAAVRSVAAALVPRLAGVHLAAYPSVVFRPVRRSFSTSRWVRLCGLIRACILALFVTQLAGLMPLGLEAVAAATEALADECACCDHESSSDSSNDCGADCDSDCGNCACPHGIRSLPPKPHRFSIMTFAAEQSVAAGRALRAPPGPDPHALFRPPRTQPLS